MYKVYRLTNTSTHIQHEACCSCKRCLWSQYLSVCSHKHSGDTQSPVLVGCVGSVCQCVCWWQASGRLALAPYAYSCPDCTSWRFLCQSPLSLSLTHTHTNTGMHAGCILPARSSWLVLARHSSFYLLIFSAIPGRGFLLAGGRGNGAGQAAWPRVQVAAVLWLLCQVVADGMTTLSFFLLSFTCFSTVLPTFLTLPETHFTPDCN